MNSTRLKGSEVFETEIMTNDEVVLFIKAANENGTDLNTAYEDMKMIDNILYAKRLHLMVHGFIKTTTRGYLRKGTSLYNVIDGIIDARCESDKEN